MRTFAAALLIPTLIPAVMLAACSGSDSGVATSQTSLTAVTVATPATSAAGSTGTAPPTSVANAAETTATIPAVSTPPGLRQITVTIGVDSGPKRIEKVNLGAQIQLTIVSPNDSDEFHLHGYDLLQPVGKGESAVFSFNADLPGTFELEGHNAKGILMLLEVG